MKKIVSMVMAVVMLGALCLGFTGCKKTDYTVGICQLMKHDSLDKATQGFIDALNEEMEKAGKTVTIDTQVAGEANLCGTVVNTFVSKKVDLIMGNATPALLAAGNATADIPVLGTSVTSYEETFNGKIPANVSGTSDAVPFDQQAQMMIDTIGLTAGDKVGVLYCKNESNSKIQYEAVKGYFEGNGITVGEYTFSEVTEMSAVVDKMVSECKAVYVPSDNTVAQKDELVGTACKEKKVPLFTSYGGNYCYASLAIDYYELGRETGKMAAQILLGQKKASDIQVMTLKPSTVYNEELCEELGITIPKK